ncbi:MAG: cysteine dioxygenase family protein [Actinomycetota bacterium]|nr:cysteine dioxygenase family protein [Actinomycetota bacterium]
MVATLSPAPQKIEPRTLADLPPAPTLRDAVFLLARLTRHPAFLDAHVYPLLEGASSAEDWHVAQSHEARDGSYSLQVFVWPPGTATQIHDHASWGAYRCVVGSVLEERYERLDDGSRPGHAHLKKSWSRIWSRGDGVSTVMPYDGGIHRVGNVGGEAAISVHLYGPRIGAVDGRDFDPLRDHVCDRVEA